MPMFGSRFRPAKVFKKLSKACESKQCESLEAYIYLDLFVQV